MPSENEIKKLKAGELTGKIATVICGVALLYFVICFTVAQAKDLYTLRLITLISAPAVMVIAAGVAAYCNLTFGSKLERLIEAYVQEVLLENAALLHPEKNSLNFVISADKSGAEVAVNNYKEKIVFDFSAFGKLSLSRCAQVYGAISTKLSVAFIRMFERGAKLTDVSYCSAGAKKAKAAFIIQGGTPDKKAYKAYLKTK